MGAAWQRLWEHLRGLRLRAECARRAQGLSVSQATVARELDASGRAALRGFSGQRINDWTPEEPGAMSIPQSRSHDKVVALAGVWAAWAGDPAPGRTLRDLLDEACDEWTRERRTGTLGTPEGRPSGSGERRLPASGEGAAGGGDASAVRAAHAVNAIPAPDAHPVPHAEPVAHATPAPHPAPALPRTVRDLGPWLLEVREAPPPGPPPHAWACARRDPLAHIDRERATEACHEALVTALRKAGSPEADAYARWARAAGKLPVASCLPHGVQLDGSQAAPCSWAAVMEQT
ncbi:MULTISPECIES: hypothetical protein [unclassified Streptomyces]|uniref:hypothetical protein n=1 Tax=unclassified Streptomyces TaxID=2593676 RepID=UPI0013699D61|nr:MULTISPECIES: hypothetical protein [unclassified Streptomyces]MYY81299.1 hypothetical protein [Streptomyces sp. SID335]MYZ18885.1 hypothetical protein [Streptomyces sp. SID337]NDZ90668.1 hypothetical protein [Streptomyces sp. SID10115]NEB43188.1 hypothetical protein [Streptomyces sp. SID339]